MHFLPRPKPRRSALSVAAVLWALAGAGGAKERDGAAREFIYIQNLSHDRVIVAWGGPGVPGGRDNGIGESSPSFGPAELSVTYHRDGRPVPGSPFRVSDRNWVRVPLPAPETEYDYRLQVNGRVWGDSLYRNEGLLRFRSFPDSSHDSGALSFLVLGDFGTGEKKQYLLAEVMRQVVDERISSPSPVRFVLTTGDNLYDQFLFWGSGSDDPEYYQKFFIPYQALLSRIPFFASLGNHDGSESEQKEDLAHYRDNFFLPAAILPDGRVSAFAERFYALSYGKDVRLICLDTTKNEETLPDLKWTPIYGDGGRSEQRGWLLSELASGGDIRWKVAWFHHPPYNGGRGHFGADKDGNLAAMEAELVPLLSEGGVRVAFSGHVHDFQITREEREGPLYQTRYVVSGAGGKSERGREGGELRILKEQKIDAINAHDQSHFLLVTIEGEEMEVTPITYDRSSGRPAALAVRSADGVLYRGVYPGGGVEPAGSSGSDQSAAGVSPYHPIRISARPR